MNARSIQGWRSISRSALGAALVSAVVAVGLAWGNAPTWWIAYRCAAFACLAPAVGSLIFVLIHRLTGGQWAESILPSLHAGVRLLPWVWLLILPLLWVSRGDFHVPADATGMLRMYFSHAAFVGRSIFYGAVFFAFAGMIGGDSRSASERRWLGPAGLIFLTFMLHLLSIDWFVALEPGWYSTGFGFVWMTSQAVAGLATAVLVALIGGKSPAADGAAGRPLGLDWGNLLLAVVLSWTYVAFVQFLIIWSGNLPPEISWYVRRGYGGWRRLVIAIAVLQFVAPLLLLLSRDVKQRRWWLGVTAALILAGQLAYTAWLILPAFPGAGRRVDVAALVLVIGAWGAFANRYLAFAGRSEARA